MSEEDKVPQEDPAANFTNQQIDTNQPKPLRGLRLRGVKPITTVTCEREDGRIITVNEEDYDPAIHGKKSAADSLPTRKKKAKKKKSD